MNHIERFYKEKNTEVFFKTQGYKKIVNFLVDLVKKDKFSAFAKLLRNKYSIPIGGFVIDKFPCSCIPEEWNYKHDSVKIKELRKEIKDFCKPYRLSIKDWISVLEGYIFYNKILISISHNSYNLCYTVDILKKKDSSGTELSKEDTNAYPVGLLISPYATERDILDYVRNIYKTEIKPLQDKYKEGGLSFVIGKSKTKKGDIQKRNDLIYKNKDLSLKEISHLIREEKLELIDEGHIGAIRSQKRKSLKEV